MKLAKKKKDEANKLLSKSIKLDGALENVELVCIKNCWN